MVTEKALKSSKYKFKNIQVNALETDESGNVLVFTASFVTTKLPTEFMSAGQIEINRTLWDQESSKRPPGYWLLGSPEKDGVMTSYFVSDEWMGQPKEVKSEKRAQWGL